ncbi:hypothetical protein GBAR_LOCUS25499, partial [Geodia barretti]
RIVILNQQWRHTETEAPFWLQYNIQNVNYGTWIAGSSIMLPPTMFHGENLLRASHKPLVKHFSFESFTLAINVKQKSGAYRH